MVVAFLWRNGYRYYSGRGGSVLGMAIYHLYVDVGKGIFVPVLTACIVLRIIGESKIYGRDATLMTTKIENSGELSLVATRHSSKEWILLPCEVLSAKNNGQYLYFKKDRLKIKCLNGLNIYKKSYVKVKAQETLAQQKET